VLLKGLVLTGIIAIVLGAAACGGGGGDGGGGGGDIVQEAAQVEQLINRLKALPDTATSDQQFMQQLDQIRTQVQQAVEDVNDADASDETESAKNKLASRLQSLRTQLGRVAGIAAGGDVEAAKRAIGSLLSVGEIEDAIQQIRDASATSG
jgi:soluble cytochrome b562